MGSYNTTILFSGDGIFSLHSIYIDIINATLIHNLYSGLLMYKSENACVINMSIYSNVTLHQTSTVHKDMRVHRSMTDMHGGRYVVCTDGLL